MICIEWPEVRKMRAILEIILSLLAVFGLLGLGWLLFGRILAPVGGRFCAVVPGTGDGGGLEQSVRGLLWLRGGGLMKCPVVIVDCGLSDQGKAVAAALVLWEPGIATCTAEELPRHLHIFARDGE